MIIKSYEEMKKCDEDRFASLKTESIKFRLEISPYLALEIQLFQRS